MKSAGSAPLSSRVTISGRRDACASFIDDQLVGSFYRVGATKRSLHRGKGTKRKRTEDGDSYRVRKRDIEPYIHSHPVYLLPPRRRRRQRAFSAARFPVEMLGVIGVVAVAVVSRRRR